MPTRRKTDKPAVSPERMAEIRASVATGRGKSMFEGANDRMHGPMCRCGVRRKPPGLAKHVVDDGLCIIHPERAPEPYVPGARPQGGQA